MKNEQNIKERLTARLNRLQEKIGETLTNGTNLEIEELFKKARQAEIDVKNAELVEKIETINTREKRRRAKLKKVLAIGLIDIDLITNDMRLNQSKRKQAPELYKLADNSKSLYFSHGYHGVINMHLDHEEFSTGKVIYTDSKASEVMPFDSFTDACERNSVLIKSLTLKQVQKQIAGIKKATNQLKAAEEKHSKALEANNSHFLKCERFFDQRNANIYTLWTTF